MRTHIELDDDVIRDIMKWGKFKTRTEAIRAALQEYRQGLAGLELLKLGGKIKWHGDLDAMRRTRYRK